MLDAGSLATCK